jgi:xanthine dehydrogenase accessory factor
VHRTELLARAEDLRLARTPYVLATVVRAQRPTSAKPGDGALIFADGRMDGFVGGTCAESTVRLQGQRLLETGESLLLRITPDQPEADAGLAEASEGLMVVNNPCLSGGSLEIFLEAVIPAPLVYVYGQAPVARALVRVGAAAGYDMVAGTAEGAVAPADASAVVVASHGRAEEKVLEAALAAKVPYVALVASRRRGDAVLASIGATRDRIHTPAGLDLRARTAAEIAVSILAEIIATRADPPIPIAASGALGEAPAAGTIAVDPVCGMDVVTDGDALRAEHAGTTVYFCGSGCKAAFISDPHRYLANA